jgi:ADP-ribose pyrophosphatase YjhB (NUDIX family)
MYIKIYFGDKPLFLADDITDEIEPYIHHDDAVFIDDFSNPGVNTMLHEMKVEKVHAGIYYHKNLEQLKKAIWKKFKILQTAGGLIRNENNEILLIFRRGKWDLPKGKRDDGETLEQCAIREVFEETHLKNVIIQKPLVTTYHSYEENGKHILKENYWYKMLSTGVQSLQPQAEEDITEVKWVAPADIPQYGPKAFPSIRDVFKADGLI